MVEHDDFNIDLMLIAVAMPGLSGPDLAQHVLTMRPDQKVLFMSGGHGEQIPAEISELLSGVLYKPFSSDSLGGGTPAKAAHL
jgi:DNA-binding NarL/FixJ family response regulator